MVIRMLWKIMGINREMVNQKIQDNSLYCKVSSYSSWIVNLFVWISQVLEEKVNFPQRKRRKGREMLQKNTDFMRTSMRNIYFLLAKANLGWPTICRILMMSRPLDSACQSLIQIQVNGGLFDKYFTSQFMFHIDELLLVKGNILLEFISMDFERVVFLGMT